MSAEPDFKRRGSPAEGSPTIFVSDPSAEADRLSTALRSRGYTVFDVPLTLLLTRVAVQRPGLILLDIDSEGALETAHRLRELPNGSDIHIVFLGDPGRTLTAEEHAWRDDGAGIFIRPIDVEAVLQKVTMLIRPRAVDDLDFEVARPGSEPAPASRPLTPLPDAWKARQSPASRNESQAVGAGPSQLPLPALSPEIEALLQGAEQQSASDLASGAPAQAPASQPPSPSDELEAVLPADILAALDEPIEDEEDEFDSESGLSTGVPRKSTSVNHGTGSGSVRPPATRAVTASARPPAQPSMRQPALSDLAPGAVVTSAGRRSAAPSQLVPPPPLPSVPPSAPIPSPPLVSPAVPPELAVTPPAIAVDRATSGVSPPAPVVASPLQAGLVPLPPNERTSSRRFANAQTVPNANSLHSAPNSQSAAGLVRADSGPLGATVPAGAPSEMPQSALSASPQPAAAAESRPVYTDAAGPSLAASNSVTPAPRAPRREPFAPSAPPHSSYPSRILEPAEDPEQGVQTARPGLDSSDRAPHITKPARSGLGIPEVVGPGDALRAAALCVQQRATGALCVDSPEGVRRMLLRDGDIVTAASGIDDESLVGFLGARGSIPRDVVSQMQGRIPAFGRHAGAALVAHGYIGQDQLWPVLRAHAEWVVGCALNTEKGTATFELEPPGRLKAEPSVFGGATGCEVLLEVIKRVIVPQVALARLGGPSTIFLEGSHWDLLSECALSDAVSRWIERSKGAPIGEALADDPSGELAPVLYGLTELGVLSVERMEGARAARSAKPDAVLFDVLDAQALRTQVSTRLHLIQEADYFALLGVARNATSYEVHRAYLDLRRAFSPARVLTAATADLADQLDLILDVLEEAHDILRDPVRRERYRRAIEGPPPG